MWFDWGLLRSAGTRYFTYVLSWNILLVVKELREMRIQSAEQHKATLRRLRELKQQARAEHDLSTISTGVVKDLLRAHGLNPDADTIGVKVPPGLASRSTVSSHKWIKTKKEDHPDNVAGARTFILAKLGLDAFAQHGVHVVMTAKSEQKLLVCTSSVYQVSGNTDVVVTLAPVASHAEQDQLLGQSVLVIELKKDPATQQSTPTRPATSFRMQAKAELVALHDASPRRPPVVLLTDLVEYVCCEMLC